ncbi:hypothetical protein RR48_06230 [Papilio machaon]|uniref:Uncharacterized protein n=1 Tax=Papilio machaon TaxID=76193 RepID=A0A194QTF0_PAPMA|nr:hypothetical protein RR48_06230 [Papilio machaon]
MRTSMIHTTEAAHIVRDTPAQCAATVAAQLSDLSLSFAHRTRPY